MDEKLDVLNREDFITKLITVVELLSENEKGCCFGIDGAWGSGKSFVLEQFESRLKDIQLEETFDNKYFVCHYDCWEYDYYDEPAIAIISAMLDVADKQVNLIPSELKELAIGTAWVAARDIIATVAGELCKNKIGVDVVTVFNESLKAQEDVKIDDFNKLYGFKRALEATRKNIQKIAETKTVVIVVDELDRCLPEYSIKVLERLHHIFEGLENVIVIVSMDKSQLEHSIKGIYGNINVDAYLRKFINFKMNLDKGKATKYAEKYASYFSLFDYERDGDEIERFLENIFREVDIRTQERIFRKAELIHKMIIEEGAIEESSTLTMEIMFLTIALQGKSYGAIEEIFEETNIFWKTEEERDYIERLKRYLELDMNTDIEWEEDFEYISLKGKTYEWINNIYRRSTCLCLPCTEDEEDTKDLTDRFTELISIIDCD